MSSEPYAIPPKDRAFEGILWYIKHYDLQGGDRLPAERVLCEELGVSRTALRAAITRLISCGTLESRRGSGTYVCPPKPLNIFQETWNYTQAVERVGSKSTARLVWSKVVYADIDLAQKAQIDLGMPLFCIRRVRVVNGSPASIETAHVNLSLCPSLPDHDFEQESLYDVLLKEGNVHVAHGKEHISIRPAQGRCSRRRSRGSRAARSQGSRTAPPRRASSLPDTRRRRSCPRSCR